MWKTLAATSHGRSILLTTHSMEEADALAGRAGILARRMLALGTPDELRHRFGDLVHVHLVAASAPRTSDDEMAAIIAWSASTCPRPTSTTRRTTASCASPSARATSTPAASPAAAASPTTASESAVGSLVVMLEENSRKLGISNYSVAPTGLDQVFLSIVGQHNVREENT
ncbi:hypothetical protein NLG97_g6498 [Lecanicillium saksenae]|uniref:Uncharacterized protein n=1 Tax=Lecanicillium saksenae TaxID=468837 RepID=A0ACC1QPG4_9HYPO|nr:hypothetical protein NLG97_g6498 [Lecanicillium saksenae]